MNDNFGNRMKGYENCSRFYLPRRMPVIVRVDGRAFHSFTRKMEKPFDFHFVESMQKTALNLAKNVAGCKIAYCQSDEISLLLTNDDDLMTEPWFGNNLQKIVSLTAAMATSFFTNEFFKDVSEHSLPVFDSRAFVLPKEEVANYFLWRQRDASRNSIQMIARSHFSNKELFKKNSKELEKMILESGDSLSEYSDFCRFGTIFYKVPHPEVEKRMTWEKAGFSQEVYQSVFHKE